MTNKVYNFNEFDKNYECILYIKEVSKLYNNINEFNKATNITKFFNLKIRDMTKDYDFRELCKTIISLEYKFQDFFEVGHEAGMKKILDTTGFVDKTAEYCPTKPEKKLMKKRLIIDSTPGDNISEMGYKNGTYVYQPFSTHGAPDFIIFINDTFLIVELKSGKKDLILWNTHIPQKNWIYIFSQKNIQKTTYFLGQEIVPDNFRPQLEEIEKLLKDTRKQIKLIADTPENKHGVLDYGRTHIKQEKGKGKRETRYINSPYRKGYERNVSTFVKNLFR